VIRTLLDITPDTVRLAERFGAKRDKRTLDWYVEGEDVPDELLNLVRKPMRTVLLSPEVPVRVVNPLVGEGSAPGPQSVDDDLDVAAGDKTYVCKIAPTEKKTAGQLFTPARQDV
jgi:hypothetical protein